MALDIKRLFDKYRVEWHDRGPNTSKDNIAIHCCFCGNLDRSHHLAINIITFEYRCLRNPKHAGRNLAFLFRKLKIPTSSYAGEKLVVANKTYTPDSRDYSALQYFDRAEESEEAITYLASRLFSRPAEICKKFDLRVSKEGHWAGRLIIPMTVGWTGRAMRSHIQPRYRAHTSEDGFFLFSNKSKSVIIVEGAIDAMRVASVSNQFDILAKGTTSISAAILNYIRERKYLSIYSSPDGNVDFLLANDELKMLRSYCTSAKVKSIKMPLGLKDYGQMFEGETRRWIMQVCQ